MNKYERLVELRGRSVDALAERVIALEDEIELLRALLQTRTGRAQGQALEQKP